MTISAELSPARLPLGVAGGGLLPRFARWAATRPDAPALAAPVSGAPGSPEVRWISRGDLLDAVLDRAARLGRAPDGCRAPVLVDPDDPPAVMIALMAAEATGRAALLRSPDWDDATTHALADQFARRFAGRCGPPSGPDRHGRTLLVLPTSGSSATPRAVVRTTRSWSAAVQPFSRFAGLSRRPPGAAVAVWAPGSLASTLTLWAVWHALATAVPVLATGPWHPRWSGSVQQAVRDGGPAGYVLQSVPVIADQVLQAVEEKRLDAPSGIVVAGAAMPGGLPARAATAGVPVSTYYGAAELSFVAAGPPLPPLPPGPAGDLSNHLGGSSAGGAGARPAVLRPFPGVAVQVRGGEIWARSPYTALGYLGTTLGTIQGGATWRDGWVTVHDRGLRTADGGLLVRGRGDTAATVGGTTVLTGDVEAALEGVPGLAEIVCLPEPDPRLGQRLVAVLRPARPACPADPGDPGRADSGDSADSGDNADSALVRRLREVARQRLAPPARPVRYVIRAELPRTRGGKVARAQLARELAGEPARESACDATRVPEAG